MAAVRLISATAAMMIVVVIVVESVPLGPHLQGPAYQTSAYNQLGLRLPGYQTPAYQTAAFQAPRQQFGQGLPVNQSPAFQVPTNQYATYQGGRQSAYMAPANQGRANLSGQYRSRSDAVVKQSLAIFFQQYYKDPCQQGWPSSSNCMQNCPSNYAAGSCSYSHECYCFANYDLNGKKIWQHWMMAWEKVAHYIYTNNNGVVPQPKLWAYRPF